MATVWLKVRVGVTYLYFVPPVPLGILGDQKSPSVPVVARNYYMARMLPREAELVPE